VWAVLDEPHYSGKGYQIGKYEGRFAWQVDETLGQGVMKNSLFMDSNG